MKKLSEEDKENIERFLKRVKQAAELIKKTDADLAGNLLLNAGIMVGTIHRLSTP